MYNKRIIICGLFILLALVGFSQKRNKHPKNIILMVGDGMGVAQIYAGLTANHGTLNLEQCTTVGFHKNQASDQYVTDSAAGATAFASGQKTYNGAIGVDANGKSIPTILEEAEKNGLATGLVATCSITHATPACFISHQPSRSLDENIALDFLKTDIDVFIGGGRKFFTQRNDGLNLSDSLKARGYQIANSIAEAQQITSGKLAAFLADEQQARFSAGRADELVKSTEVALQLLKSNKKGMFMMIEGSQIDWGGHGNDTQYIVDEMIDFDNAIGKVINFAKKDGKTLVVITADHETGGLILTGGDLNTRSVAGNFCSTDHTAVMVPVFSIGPGAERFSGIHENTFLFQEFTGLQNLK